MKRSSLVKPIVICFLIIVISCAGGPQVKEIAALHYGDDEADVVGTLGEGSELFFFELSGIEYHYRFYTTTLTEHRYALLFADGKLFGVSQDRPPFYECIYPTVAWDGCFASAIAEMRTDAKAMQGDAFSDALTKEEKVKERRATAAVVGAPVLIVAWPIFLGIGAMCAIQEGVTGNWSPLDDMEHSRQKSECRKSFHKIEERLGPLFPSSGLHRVIEFISDATLDLSEHGIENTHEDTYDLSEGKRRVYGKHWACGDYATRVNLVIMYGAEGDRLIWMAKNLVPVSKVASNELAASKVADALLQRYWDNTKHQDAKKWLCRSADTGYSEAQYRVGLLYENGAEGVPKDLVRAYMWYRLAAGTDALSDVRAAQEARRIRQELSAEQAAQAEILIREWKPGQCERKLALVNQRN